MKKFLSLVLALVMAMSLVTISAGAADFDDSGDIQYKEAVDVISALGIVDGYSDGTFRPDGSLTRGAAAKIICNLILGPTTADALSASTAPFRDVPTTNTFAGYITYCSQQGIISGYGDGTFRPTGTLTGNAFMKMLLGALGYDSDVEGYTGSNWQVNVVKQAVGIGLDDGNDNFVGSQPVTRQEAALYAFNMINATMVEYDTRNTVSVGDITINTIPSRNDVANTGSTDGNIDGERDGDGLMQFGERYFTDLEKQDDTDLFGRPATKWVYDREDVGTYANDADATYVVEDADMTVGEVVTSSSYMNYSSSEARSAEYFFNGDDNTMASSDEVKKGDIVEAYEDDNGNVETVVVRRYTVARIDAVDSDVSTTESRNGASEVLTLTSLDGDHDYGDYYDSYDDAAETLRGYDSSYDEGTVLAVAFRDNNAGEVLDSYVAEDVTGSVTAYRAGETITIDGTRYEYVRYRTDLTDVDGATDNFDFNDEYTIYLTAEGYVIGVEGATAVDLTDVYYVAGVYGEESRYNSGNFTYYAQAVSLADGTVSDIELDEEDGALDNSGNWVSDPNAESDLHSVIGDSAENDGEYQPVQGLYTFDDDIATAWDGDGDYDIYGVDNSGSLDATLTEDLAMDDTRFSTSDGRFYVDENTQYLAVDAAADDIDTTYAVGGMKAEVPATRGDEQVIVIADHAENRDAVYVILVDYSASVSSADVLYAAGDSVDRVGSGEYVREFWSMEDNTADDVTINKDNLDANGAFYQVKNIDADGIYELEDFTGMASNNDTIDDESDDVAVDNLELSDPAQIYRNSLTNVGNSGFAFSGGTVSIDDVSIANATIIDARSTSARNSSVYDREVNTISRLEAALDAADEAHDVVTIDLYVKNGEITFICVQNVGGTVSGGNTGSDAGTGFDGTTTAGSSVNSDSALKGQRDGVYTFASGASLDGVSDINGGIENNLFFKFTTGDNAYATLVIYNEDGDSVYEEGASFTGAGGHYFYVQVLDPENGGVDNAGTGSLETKPLTVGTYTYEIYSGNDTLLEGEFDVVK